MNKKCSLCQKDLDNKSANYLINTKCNCEFHFDCYDKKFPNYYSIYFPKCPNCNIHYRKEFIECSENITYEEAFRCWIGKKCIERLICKSDFCFNIAKLKYLNYCKEHFYKIYDKDSALLLIKGVLIYCMGMKSGKKMEVLKNIANL